MEAQPRVALRYRVERTHEDWTLSEEQVPESRSHDLVTDRVKLLLLAWVARSGQRLQVGRNLAIRWDEEHPNVGVDPDVYVIEPTPEGDSLSSLRLWEEGHTAPLLAVEVVSPSNSKKDYVSAPEKYAASGTEELWIFDPQLAGPKAHGGPLRLQIWRRDGDEFSRIHAGEGPAWSPAVGAWLFAVDEGRQLRIASDEAGTDWWMTGEEASRAAKDAERAEKDAERAAKEAERAAKEEALRRVAELEAKLAARS
jgi:Uma2 family endonuclease